MKNGKQLHILTRRYVMCLLLIEVITYKNVKFMSNSFGIISAQLKQELGSKILVAAAPSAWRKCCQK